MAMSKTDIKINSSKVIKGKYYCNFRWVSVAFYGVMIRPSS